MRATIAVIPNAPAHLAATFACRCCGHVFADTIEASEDPFETECRGCGLQTAEPIELRDDDGRRECAA